MEKQIICVMALLAVWLAAPSQADEAKADAEQQAAPVAYVLSCKPVAECQAKEGADYVTLEPGSWLGESAHITTSATGRVCLQYHDNSLVQIEPGQGFDVGARKAGSRPNMGSDTAGVPRQTVASRFWTAIKSFGGEMEATAGVRGGPAVTPEIGQAACMLEVPRGGRVMGRELCLRWSGGEPNKPYVVRVVDKSGKELYVTTTSRTCVVVDLDGSGIVRGGAYDWKLGQPGVEGAETAQARFYRLTKQEERCIKKEVKKQRKGAMKDLASDAQHVSMALFYASNDLLAEAERELKEVGDPALADPLLEAIHSCTVETL